MEKSLGMAEEGAIMPMRMPCPLKGSLGTPLMALLGPTHVYIIYTLGSYRPPYGGSDFVQSGSPTATVDTNVISTVASNEKVLLAETYVFMCSGVFVSKTVCYVSVHVFH